jgi:hypothetical protein
MSVVSINGFEVVSVKLHVPHRGAWWAKVELTDAPELEGSVEIAIDELLLTGTVLPSESGTHGGHRRTLVFAGAAGWGTEMAPQHYRADTGVRARLVAEDAARAAGESLGTFEPAAERLGPHYVLQTGFARRVLEDVIGDVLWWVDNDGVTHVAAERPTVEANEDNYRVIDYDPIENLVTIELEDPREIVVGSVLATEGLDDELTVRELDLMATSGGLDVQVWTGEGRYGRADSNAYRVHHRYADARLWGSWRYRVTRQNGVNLDCRPVLAEHGLPELVNVELSPGIPGADADLADGTEVLIEFVEGNRALPRVVAFAGRDQATWTPTELVLDGDEVLIGRSAIKGGARLDDSVSVTIPTGTVGVGAPLNASPIVLTGSITGASSKVRVE